MVTQQSNKPDARPEQSGLNDFELSDLINNNLCKAIALCNVVMDAREADRKSAEITLWTAIDILHETKAQAEEAFIKFAQERK